VFLNENDVTGAIILVDRVSSCVFFGSGVCGSLYTCTGVGLVSELSRRVGRKWAHVG
jgi:hypothetical protein